jgi:hypothetical protein
MKGKGSMKRVTCLVAVMVVLVFCGTGHADLSHGLVAYYPFDGNAMDESGNGNHGTVVGAVPATDHFGNSNHAYSFDGQDDYIDCGKGSSLDGTEALSIVIWIKSSSLDGGRRIISKRGSEAGYELVVSDNKVRFVTNGSFRSEASLAEKINEWIFIAVTWDQSQEDPNINMYVDDNDPITGFFAGPLAVATGDLYIGAWGPDQWVFNGIIDDARIYNRALSPSEVQALYQDVSRPVADAGPDQVVIDEVVLDGSGSNKVEGGTIESWEWVLVHRTNSDFNRVASGENPTISDLPYGFYDVTLTVTDDSALSDTDTCLLAATGSWDLDGDGKVGNVEALYILQMLAGLRQ